MKSHLRRSNSRLPHDGAFEFHGAKARDAAVDVVIVVALDEANAGDFGAGFEGILRAFDPKGLGDDHIITVLEDIADGIANDQAFFFGGGAVFGRFWGIERPRMSARRAVHENTVRITVF